MSYWIIEDFLGTSAIYEETPKGVIIVDIRDLEDDWNDPLEIRKKAQTIIKCLSRGPVIIRCQAGISRSSALAVTVLCLMNGKTWDENEALVKTKVGRAQINLSLKKSCLEAIGEC